MHRLQGIEMVYCISILENFSRAILASAISVRQDTEAFFAVFYAAVRKYGVPEILVSDNGSFEADPLDTWTGFSRGILGFIPYLTATVRSLSSISQA
jgi:hypothetical protein